MTVVIQCAATKRPNAAHLVTAQGKLVNFVADPQAAPYNQARLFARPDDLADDGLSWRQVLSNYNAEPHNNPLRLYRAFELYENKVYRRLVDRLGPKNVYILLAGWGLIGANFLTPYYDITFSPSAERYKRRRKGDRYSDFCMLPDNLGDEILFFGGKDYLPLFYQLTRSFKNKKTVFYNSIHIPGFSGFRFKRFETSTKTNWHYECVQAYLDGMIHA